MRNVDVAVVGAGIVGLAVAWEAARRGRSVVVFERDPAVRRASVRNFGMVWPVGQQPGADYVRALVGRRRWLELRSEARLWVDECGSLHAVYEDDEWELLQEFRPIAAEGGVACELLGPAQASARCPGLVPEGLRGALFSPMELCVDPREALATIPRYLAERFGVEFRFGTAVRRIDMPQVETAEGETWKAERAFVCGGTDFETLYPAEFAASGLVKCKLQMMATGPQPGNWRLGPHLAGGLTLGHYKGFELCAGLRAVKARQAERFPRHKDFGIHVMASQNRLGEVVIGDSHEYGPDPSPFDNPEIDRLILDYFGRMARLPDPAIARRWHGVYAKHPTETQFAAQPQPGCTILASPGGAGMTLAFGLASELWESRP